MYKDDIKMLKRVIVAKSLLKQDLPLIELAKGPVV